MSAYVPNDGEKEMLKNILRTQAVILGLYQNQVVPDGNTTMNTLEEMPTGGERGYAQIALTNVVKETPTPGEAKWSVAMNAAGKAEAQYGSVPQEWVFAAADVADGATMYGIFGYTWVLPVSSLGTGIKVGNVIKGVTSGATGVVTAVFSYEEEPNSGYFCLKLKTGTFQHGENITIMGAIATVAVNAGGSGYAVGDILTMTQEGAVGAKLVVSAVNAGVVTGVVVVEGGQEYSVATGLPTTKITGAGNNDCTIDISTVATTAYAVANTGATGDAHKKLLFLEPLSTPKLVETVGQKLTYLPKMVLSTV